ncbi:MAG: GH3 auxin-responsive promoter family protein [Dehalococcoidales bacterium]|nr:GH3 auxin-responsive promoter family protein [Dehalococcoidales bacterium]MDD5122838.1 GH3 auxin-responsive promoter family protein [Dehalococcoidales bacterium]
MSTNVDLFKQGRHEELWQRCCGFIDLSIEEFSQIQKRLLLEQIELFKKCEMGKKLFNGERPETIEEFRSLVPLTTYADYAPHLLRRRKEGLPRKPILWQCTSGKSGESTFRWVPVTSRQLEEIEPLIFALIFFSSCRKRGEVRFKEGDNVFYGMAPPPYATGTMTRVLPHEIFNFLPPVELSETVSFEERTKLGFKMALEKGLDLCFAMSSVAVAIGNRFNGNNDSSSFDLRAMIMKPGMAARLIKGLVKSKINKRKLLPRDIFKLKGMITFGLDGVIYREKIREMWGRYPLDFHGCTEAVVIATQTWDYEGMTFIPNLNFFEFITEEDSLKSYQDESFVPPTYLIDEIKPGNYELVITSFHGGPFARYRLGHLVKIHSLRNEKLGIDIPQMSFIGRVDDQIDIAGFTRLSEKVIWQAIERSGVAYSGWTARKEVADSPVLNIYIELKGEKDFEEREVASRIHRELKKLDVPYSELESFTGLNPLAVTILPEGALAAYKQYQIASGADISQLKPPHLNPSDETIYILQNPQTAASRITVSV